MKHKVGRFIEDNRLIGRGGRVLAAVSGGADSVTLLHLLISLKEEYDIELYAAHFNHGIRGAEADRDEQFVREWCEESHIPLFCEKADVPAAAAKSGESLELCGRKLRYRFLEKVADDLGGALIATAHHSGDNAETVLWNLTRGSGIGGLCGIPVKRGDIIRPLLCCSRAEIEEYCAEHHLQYVTDSTNLSDDYTRNILRHQVMPVLKALNPAAEEHILSASAVMREADDYLRKISAQELKKAETPYGRSCEKLLRLDPIILKYAVMQIVREAGAQTDALHLSLIVKAMRDGGAVDLGRGFSVSCAQGNIRVIAGHPDEAADFCVPLSEYIQTHGTRFSVRKGTVVLNGKELVPLDADSQKIHNLLLYHAIPCDIISPDTVVRYRRAGDVFTDSRRQVTKTLKKLFNEEKIPREERGTILLVAEGNAVLWLSGFGTSAQARADLTRDGDYIVLCKGVEACIRI